MNQAEALQSGETLLAPGERLRQAREARNLTIEDVATHLRLSVAKIEAMERGEVADIVAPVYLAGYLRAYARMVELAPEEIVGEFESLAKWAPPVIEPVPTQAGKFRSEWPAGFAMTKNGSWRAVMLWGVVGLVLIAMAAAWWQLREGARETPAMSVAEVPLLPPLEPSLQGDSEQPAAAIVEEPSVSIESTAPDQEPLAPRAQLVVTLADESWVEIVDAQGNRLMHELASAGQTHTLTGVAPFEVMLGFASGVKLYYNGAPYDLSRFKNRRTARFTLGASGDRMSSD